MMPSKGNEARSAAMAELAVLLHDTLTAPQLATALEAAKTESVRSGRGRVGARDGAAVASREPDPGVARRGQESRRHALRARVAHAAARRTTGPASSSTGGRVVDCVRARGDAARRGHRPVALRRARRPLRARHDERGDRADVRRAQALAPAADPGRAREAAHRAGDRCPRARSRSPRSARSASRSWRSSASTSRPAGSTSRRTRSAAASPRTCASPRATARTTSSRPAWASSTRPATPATSSACRASGSHLPLGMRALDGHPREPEPVVRDAARAQPAVPRADRAARAQAPRRSARVRGRQPARGSTRAFAPASSASTPTSSPIRRTSSCASRSSAR